MPRFYHVKFHLLVTLSILLGCLAPQTSWAVSLRPGDGVKTPVSLSGNMSVLRDPTGALTIGDVASGAAKARFEPIPSMLTEGYRKGAVWVRFSLSAPEASNPWLLQIERPLIQNATLYVPDGRGHFVASVPGLGHADDSARAYPAVFPISAPPTPAEYYVRLQSMTSITTALNIWKEDGYRNSRRTDDWIIGILIGGIGAMIFANALYAFWLKDSIYVLYSLALLTQGLITLFHMGYASELLGFMKPQWIRYSWGIIVCFYSIFTMLFLSRLFEFRRNWIWAGRVFQGVTLLNSAALVFAVAGRYGDVGAFVSQLWQLSIIFAVLFVLYLLVVQRRRQYLLPAIALACLAAVSLVMQLQYTGINPFHIDGSPSRAMAIGTLIHLVLLSAAVAKRTQLAERNLLAEKDRVLAMSLSAERDLTVKVQERTAQLAQTNASLEAEVERRHGLEVKLRQSLDSVNDALAEQKDFVALVSHEFRGPLAVIDAAAGNLALSAASGAGDIKPFAATIRRTVRRMSTLIENVLAGDQLDTGKTASVRIGMFDLNEVLSAVQAGLDDEAAQRVRFIPAGEALVMGDRNLLEVALQNLVHNALKYSAATGMVTVRLRVTPDGAAVEVADNGAGVAEADQERIFLRYYRAAGQRLPGSGLGLFISRKIVRQHGGDLILAATGADGSLFRLSLPNLGANPR